LIAISGQLVSPAARKSVLAQPAELDSRIVGPLEKGHAVWSLSAHAIRRACPGAGFAQIFDHNTFSR